MDQDVQSFLTEFYYGGGIFAAMPDMQQLLRDYPDTLAVHYANLVPRTVSFDQFWSRYYYQCSATTILHEWRIEQQEQEQERLFEQEQNDSTIEFYNMDNNNTDAQPSGNKSNTGSGGAVDGGDSSSNPLLLEDQTAARAQIFYEESVSDIIETIPEQNEKNENDNDDDGENLDNSNDDGCFYNVAIGLAEHGIQE